MLVRDVDSSETSIDIHQGLNAHLATLFEAAQAAVQSQEQQRLVSLRKPLIEILKAQLDYAVNTVLELSSRTEYYLYSYKYDYLDKIDANNISDERWGDLIHYLHLETPTPKHNKSFKMFLLIRHYFDLLYKEKSLLSDDLNSLVNQFQNEKLTDDYYQKLFDTLKKRHYLPSDTTINCDHIKKLEPIFVILKEKKLLSKINFLRILLCPRPETNEVRQMSSGEFTGKTYTNYFSTSQLHFYQENPAKIETLLAFIKLMNDLNILNQKNLEILFNIIGLLANRRNVDTPELLYTCFNFFCEENIVDANNDLFEKFMYDWHRDSCALKDEEKTLADAVNRDDLTAIMAGQLNSNLTSAITNSHLHLQNADTPLLQQLETTTALIQFIDKNTQISNVDVNSIAQYIPHISFMMVLLFKDNIHTTENITALMYNAKNVNHILLCYPLLKQYKTFDSPQEIFEALMKVAEFSEHIHQLLLWLPLELRTRQHYQAILDNAPYAKDLLEVSNYELSLFRKEEEIENGNDSPQIKNLRTKNTYFIFNFNLTDKKPFLKHLAIIYKFISKNNVGIPAQLYTNFSQNVQFLPQLAENLKEDLKFETRREANQFFDEIYRTTMDTVIAENKKWLASIPQGSKVMAYISGCAYSLTVNKAQLIEALLYLESQNLLIAEWIELLQEHTEHSLKLAQAITNLNTNGLLQPRYIDLLKSKPEYADSIVTVLIGYNESNSLTGDNFQTIKNNLNSITQMATLFAHREARLEAAASQLEAAHSDAVVLPTSSPFKTSTSRTLLTLMPGGDEEKEEKLTISVQRSIDDDTGNKKSSVVLASNTQSETLPVSRTSEDKIETLPVSVTSDKQAETAFIQELIRRCKVDFKRSGFFSRSVFLAKFSDALLTPEQVKEHMCLKPRSRTSKNYMHLLVDRMPEGDFKKFWEAYFTDYTFSFYQRSKLIDKFLEGKINSLNDLIAHAASDKSNRSAKILNNFRL